MANKKLKTFEIAGTVKMNISIQIEADSFQDALDKSKSLNELDFVEVLGDYLDGEFLGITSIYSHDPAFIK